MRWSTFLLQRAPLSIMGGVTPFGDTQILAQVEALTGLLLVGCGASLVFTFLQELFCASAESAFVKSATIPLATFADWCDTIDSCARSESSHSWS